MSTSLLELRQNSNGPPGMNPHNLKPPYPPTNAALGGVPTVSVDVPITAVFLFLFILGAVSHMVILQVNLRRGHKFLISGMLFGFCMARIVTMVMRIVWATRPMNIRVAIAANIFVYAGVVLLFIANLIFAQRTVRACHPNSGWHPAFHHFFTAVYVWTVLTLVMLLTSVIQSFYTLNHNTKRIDRDVLLYGQTAFTVISFLPFLLVIGGLVIPRTTRVEKFGYGRFRTKVAVLLASTFLVCLGAAFRAGTTYAGGERPRENPAGYQSKACFYIFNFTIEWVVVMLFVFIRVDKRFYVPNHSKKPGDYSREPDFYTRRKQGLVAKPTEGSQLASVITPEEEVFDDMTPDELAKCDDVEQGLAKETNPAEAIPLEAVPAPEPAHHPGVSPSPPPAAATTLHSREPMASPVNMSAGISLDKPAP